MQKIKRLLLVVFLIPGFLFGQQVFKAKVVGVTDGDTIIVLPLKEDSTSTQIKIRLNGIDCPEKKQDFGYKAKEVCSSFCYGKVVTVKAYSIDKYGRTIADIILADNSVLNEKLLSEGMAWHYKKYSKDQRFAGLEDIAKKNKIGLWSSPAPIPPWEFRANK